MKSWIKRCLRLTFGLVPHERVDYVYDKWYEMLRLWHVEREQLASSLDSLTRAHERTVRENVTLSESNRNMMLELCIVDVGPVETMDRTLDILKSIDVEMLETYTQEKVVKAISEMERGLETMRKQPSVKRSLAQTKTGGNNA